MDGYLRPVESPRSPANNLISPPPPYSGCTCPSDYDNKFFGSDTSFEEENSCKKFEEAEVVLLDNKRLSSVSEIKAKVNRTVFLCA